MMELPNYSNQLMQQLWALRKEGHFCDCSILVGDTRHQAHKLVLAASSLLFRSLLEGSDTISIDTAVVSSQEFGCLLHMLYTGKLPLGKHNVSRIVSAADSLQMFDVAVGFKNVLSNLVPQQPVAAAPSPHTSNHTPAVNGACSDSPQAAAPSKDTDRKLPGEQEDAEGPTRQRTHEELCESSERQECGATEMQEGGQEACERSVLDQCSQLVESLLLRPAVVELLKEEAQSGLDEASRKVVCQCCEEAEPCSVLEKLLGQVQDGQLSVDDLLTLLRSVALKASSPTPTPTEVGGQQSNMEPQDDPGKDGEAQKAKDSGEEESGATPTRSPATSYSCRRCKKSFNYKCRLLAHNKRCLKSGGGEAPGTHADRKTLQRQQRAARPSKRVTCDLCTRSFAHPSGMIYHKRTEHYEEKPFACEECGAKFGANSSLKNHMRLHTGEKPFDCKHCDMSFTVAAALAYHTKKKHSEGKMYACQYCKAVFAQSIELTRHVRTHTGDRPYVCRECGKGYSQASGLTIHLQTFHKLSEPHDCQKCSLSFSSLEEHQKHIEDFHSKDFHKCPSCSKVFTSALLLDKHKITHAGTKPFRCDLCNKSYQQLSGLWYHNRTNHPDVFASHTRQLKSLVQCDVCFKFFPSFTSVILHQAAEHHGSKVSTGRCPLCPAVLDGDGELQEHIRSQHTSGGGEAFSCLFCSLVCTSQLELQEHLLACHVESQQGGRGGEQASISYTVVSTEPTEDKLGGAEPAVQPEEQQQQRVLVALAGGTEGAPSAEVVEVNMYDLLNNSVTFICEDRPPAPNTSA